MMETTHPREGTETDICLGHHQAVPETTHPREGTETPARPIAAAAAILETTHPREGTETELLGIQ